MGAIQNDVASIVAKSSKTTGCCSAPQPPHERNQQHPTGAPISSAAENVRTFARDQVLPELGKLSSPKASRATRGWTTRSSRGGTWRRLAARPCRRCTSSSTGRRLVGEVYEVCV